MSEPKHTPGPWIRQGQWATEKGLAECIEAEGWGIIGAWIDRSNEPEQNFDLICAAPDLLASLRTLVAAHSCNCNSLRRAREILGADAAGGADGVCDHCAACAVIARAEGRA